MSKTPTYLAVVFAVPIDVNGALNAGMNVTSAVAAFSSAYLANYLIDKSFCRKLTVRKLFQSVCMFGPALCMALVPVMGCNLTGVVSLIYASCTMFFLFPAGEWTVVSDYAPNLAGTVVGFVCTFSFAMGFVAPFLAGIILNEDASRQQWNIIFYLYVAFMSFSGVVFNFMGTDVQQEWDKIEELPVEPSPTKI